jgi:hypothetical protein
MIYRRANPDRRGSLVDRGIVPSTYRIQTKQNASESAGEVSISRVLSPLICFSREVYLNPTVKSSMTGRQTNQGTHPLLSMRKRWLESHPKF